jgi:hypothetical protein
MTDRKTFKYSAENFLWAAHKFDLEVAKMLKEGQTPRHLQSQYSDYKSYLENVFASQAILYGYSFLDCLASKLLEIKRWKISKKGRRIKNKPSLHEKWMKLFQMEPGKHSRIKGFLKYASNLRSEIPHSKLSKSWFLQPSSYNYSKASDFHKRTIDFLKNSLESNRYKIKPEHQKEIQRFSVDPDGWTHTWLNVLKYNLTSGGGAL